jgi:hypothetical protein
MRARRCGWQSAAGDIRPDAVGADQRDAAFVHGLTAAARLHGDAVAMRDEILDLGAELKRDVLRGARGRRQHGLQIAAMNGPIGRAVKAFGLVAKRDADDLAARAARHHPHRVRAHDRRPQSFAETEADQDTRGVRRQLYAGAGFLKTRRLLDNGHAQAGAGQRQRRCQTRNACAGDDDMTRGRQGSMLQNNQAAAVKGRAQAAGRAACGSSAVSSRYIVEQ